MLKRSGKEDGTVNISTCVGEYAKTPYYIQNLGIRVYCMEELCYCLRENAFLLDTELMADGLVHWISRECALADLGKELHKKVHQKGSLSGFITDILKYTGFYDMETIRQVEQTLKKAAGQSILERRKSRMDSLVVNKKYAVAIRGYGELLEDWEAGQSREGKAPGRELCASILHNRGTAYIGLMQYREAAQDYWQAYQMDGSTDSLQCYLAARRMELPQEDYIALAAELQDSLDTSLKLEQYIQQIEQDWEKEPEAAHLARREQLRLEKQKYYEDNERLIVALKESYRSSISI